jgi:K+-sensing histidine kinase KdpD
MKKSSPHPRKPRHPARRTDRDRKQVADRLRRNTLFTNVGRRQVTSVLARLTIERYPRGGVIFSEEEPGRDLYLIASGKVRITKFTRGGIESRLALLHEGDFFGELSIIDGTARSARVEAVEETVLARLTAGEFRKLIQSSEAFTFNLLQTLAVRLRTIDHTFVHELERNTRALKSRMEKLHLLVEASKTVNSSLELDRLLVVIMEFAARTIHADRGTLYLLDRERQELWSKIVQGDNMLEIRLPIGKGLAGYVATTGQTVNIADAYKDPRFNPEIDRKSGYHTHNVLCMPMKNKEGEIVGVFQFLNRKGGAFTDEDEAFIEGYSVHAALAIENAHLARRMVDNERLSAVGRMAGSIIHDIKNPMNTLRMYAQVIKSKAGNEEASRYAEEIMRQIDRFVHMAQDILDYSRGVSEMHAVPVSLDGTMTDILTFLALELSRRNVTIERSLGCPGTVHIDVDKMIRVFYNLATNAADAMPNGGTLRVTTAGTPGGIHILFTDTGPGMPDEVRNRMFEPFFTHGKKHGTGLGLAIVKKIVDDHKGTITVTSEAGKGTTFDIMLPAEVAMEDQKAKVKNQQ